MEKRRRTRSPPARPSFRCSQRFEGMWVVGLPGTGKTQLFQYLFCPHDLDLVAKGQERAS